MKNTELLRVAKTFKLFIGGEFPRTESGRSFPVYKHKSKKLFANLCLASRKDLRNAVTAAQAAQTSWASKSAYNRSQILYRMAEMTEGKRLEFNEVLTETVGLTPTLANKAVDQAIDAFIYFAGFADKYQQVIGSVNPVSGPHHNFTSCEAVGVVGLIGDDRVDLGRIAGQIAAIIASGNSVVVLLGENGAAVVSPLAEVFATSDLPKGVVNLLTGSREELYKHFGTHMEIQSMSVQASDSKLLGEIKEMAAGNLKRVVGPVEENLSLEHLVNFVEYKTVWHPIGH
jgi:acyl-CoA reductase-like NAD-dependent aldehyde dehydrogenase